ncbi:MAG: amidohydrolase family protein, partial [Alphaproteobacteria bacterium]|nr:amidohydrolase family protein [Alphaproteobacteria bacterium]
MTAVLFENARVLDVVAGRTLAERHVLVENGRIKRISEAPAKSGDAVRVDVRGRVLMPGLCDGHIHAISASNSFA